MNTYHIRNIGNFVLFRDKADRIFFNNKFAAICYNYGIEVLALCILSTHFHAVVCGENENIIKELEHILKVAYGMHYRHKYSHTVGNKFKTRHTLISGREIITDKLIYVMANPVHHYITESPFTYQFSSANYIFTQDYLPINFRRALTAHLTPFGNLPLSRQRQLVSKDRVPSGWLVDPDGFISPNSFINVPKSRAYFNGSYKRFKFLIETSVRDKNQETIDENKQAVLCDGMDDDAVCRLIDTYTTSFSKKSFHHFSEKEVQIVLVGMKKRGIPYEQCRRCLWLEESRN
ncbi:MAG: transposase [Bacteroidales bacterium]|nr:transposase [Candidatus Equibacterium intestinale]